MVGVTPGPCNTSESSGLFEDGPVFIGEAVVVSGIFISEGCLLGFELFEFALLGATIVLGDWPDDLQPDDLHLPLVTRRLRRRLRHLR